MAIDALVFDKDGTLFDFAATWGTFGRAALEQLSKGDMQLAADLGRAIGFDFEQESYDPNSIVIAGTVDEVAGALKPHLSETSLEELVDTLNRASAEAQQVQAVPLASFLEELRQAGLRLGVATNDAEKPALQHLHSVGVRDHFDFVAGYDSGHGYKPGPGQLLAFAQHVEVEPSRIAMVGDSLHDLEAGRAAGMVTIGVLTGMATAETLEPLADVVLPNIGHIPSWLSKD
ncbi:phosphoglycolate phosphatase [Ruegeria halocynthiae]|uniref:phosphoglycolate phosphatase n=1 Tax=Ruegeria halocynthiae TaxID=985054 RepID=A0A1H2RPX8_9RHOB|nr:HAD family hydrolase [Ruegeria halocynthiae]SDW20844.1 phosphoglycolate phosphatase [Ruegeria halocynthiae]